MRNFVLTSALTLLLFLAGCGTLIKTHNKDTPDKRFFATRCDLALLWQYWAPSKGGFIDINEFKFMTPVSLIDIPFAIILDTAQFPWDIYNHHKAAEIVDFWDIAFQTDVILNPSPQSLSIHTQDKIYSLLTNNKNPIGTNTLNYLVPIAISNSARNVIQALSRLPCLSSEQYHAIYQWQKPRVQETNIRHNLAENQSIPLEILIDMTSSENEYIVIQAITTGKIPLFIVTNKIEMLTNSGNDRCKRFIASHHLTPIKTLQLLATNNKWYVQEAVAKNTNTLSTTLQLLSISEYKQTRSAVATNPFTSTNILAVLSKDPENCVRKAVAENKNTTKKTLLEMGSDNSLGVKISLARNHNTPIKILKTLTSDKNTIVKFDAQKSLREINAMK